MTTRVVRIAVPVSSVDGAPASVSAAPIGVGLLAAIVLGVVVVVAPLAARCVRRIAAPRPLRGVARDRRTPPPPLGAERATTSGVLESQLARDGARPSPARSPTMRVERERLEAILRGMVEGVLVTDLHGPRRPA